MTLTHPFAISARLLPAVQVGDAWISYEAGAFIIDLPDGSEHRVTGLYPPRCFVQGRNDTPERMLVGLFAALCSFLGACAESRAHAVRRGKEPMDGENSDLFTEPVGAWAETVADELAIIGMELDENPELITP